jgi:hypothetical protein
MLAAGLHGREEIRRVEALLLDVPRELNEALKRRVRPVLEPLKKDIPATAARYMPSGYGPLLARSTKVYIRVGSGAAFKATVRVMATGKSEQRDIAARNRGSLRHKFFGKTSYVNRFGARKSGWFDQRVRPGFVDVPVEAARHRVVDAAEKARDDIADHILEG